MKKKQINLAVHLGQKVYATITPDKCITIWDKSENQTVVLDRAQKRRLYQMLSGEYKD